MVVKMNELALFAGAGGGILAGHLLGWRTVCAVEQNEYAASVLAARQNDGTFAPFPIWDDVCTFDGKPWRGLVDVVSGGFPCQDISVAGKGAGIDGERSGLWREMARIIGEIQPRYVFVENSPMLIQRGLAVVLGDLASMGYDAEWCCLSAQDIGAPHIRDRVWIVANSKELQRNGSKDDSRVSMEGKQISEFGNNGWQKDMADTSSQHEQWQQQKQPYQEERKGQDKRQIGSCRHEFGQWPSESGLGRVADGLANRSHRLKAIGNGQVPKVAAAAFSMMVKQYEP